MQPDEYAARLRARVDAAALARIRERYTDDFVKYTNADEWVATNVRHAVRAGLFGAPARDVLDLGAGPGWFVLVARELGHRVTGVDVEHGGVLGDIARTLGVTDNIADYRVTFDRPLPDDRTWDVITAHMITFNGHHNIGGIALWGVREWSTFLDAISARLRGDRTMTLEMNREDDGSMFPPGVEELFRSRGAVIDGRHATFRGLR